MRPMRVLRCADHASMPWKNGGGTTAEIAISPPGASLDSFDWRISMAHVASEGPFSRFAGIDRTLAIIEGAGLRLSVDGRAVELTIRSSPFAFPGEAETRATLLSGAITDLNVMTRRDRYTHRVARLAAPADWVASSEAAILVVFCGSGATQVRCQEQTVLLNAKDSLLIEAPAASLRFDGDAMLLVVEVFALSSPSP